MDVHERLPDLHGHLERTALAPCGTAATQLVGDAGGLVEHGAWPADVLAARSVPREVVADAMTCLDDTVAGACPACSALFREAGARLAPAAPR